MGCVNERRLSNSIKLGGVEVCRFCKMPLPTQGASGVYSICENKCSRFLSVFERTYLDSKTSVSGLVSFVVYPKNGVVREFSDPNLVFLVGGQK